MIAGLLAHQLGQPSGLVGRRALARTWNRRNRTLNDAALHALALHPDDWVLRKDMKVGGPHAA